MRNQILVILRLVCMLLVVNITSCRAQPETQPVHTTALEYADTALFRFKLKMDSLRCGKRKKVRIVHIGDSHIQPDKFTGEIRNELQTRYGNGGRGFIFPYAAAKTSGPRDYTTTTCANWNRTRNVDYNPKQPLGLAGMVIQSLDDSGSVCIRVGSDSLPNGFSRTTLIFSGQEGMEVCLNKDRRKQAGASKVNRYDTLCCTNTLLSSDLRVAFRNGNLCLYGLYVENESPGIVYNSIGVAGARFTDYCRSNYFFAQLELLNADLVIISLGTNESYNSHYTDEAFLTSAGRFLEQLRKACPHADIILTCPSENYYLRKKQVIENIHVAMVNTALRHLAFENKLAIWDLYKAMGGKGSMKEWKKQGMVNNDYIHFLKSGYKLQGELFSGALMDFIGR